MAARATPATRAAAGAGVRFSLHEYEHDPGSRAYGREAAAALGLEPARVFKTLVVAVADELVACLIPVDATLDLRLLGKRASLAPVERARRVTGYVAGGISPLGQRRALPTLLDQSALSFETIFVSGGRRGLELELEPRDLIALTGAQVRGLVS